MNLDRRLFLTTCSRLGVLSPLFPGVLYTLAAQGQTSAPGAEKKPEVAKITPQMIDQAAEMAGVIITPEQKSAMIEGLTQQRAGYEAIRALKMPNAVAPALIFDPLAPGAVVNTDRRPMRISKAPALKTVPSNLEDLAFSSVRELAEYVRTKKVSSVALTEMYLARLKRYDPTLHFVITLTEERAMAHAREADREIAAGKYRGPLHGLPWGAKDLLAVKGYPTTWGAGGF